MTLLYSCCTNCDWESLHTHFIFNVECNRHTNTLFYATCMLFHDNFVNAHFCSHYRFYFSGRKSYVVCFNIRFKGVKRGKSCALRVGLNIQDTRRNANDTWCLKWFITKRSVMGEHHKVACDGSQGACPDRRGDGSQIMAWLVDPMQCPHAFVALKSTPPWHLEQSLPFKIKLILSGATEFESWIRS